MTVWWQDGFTNMYPDQSLLTNLSWWLELQDELIATDIKFAWKDLNTSVGYENGYTGERRA